MNKNIFANLKKMKKKKKHNKEINSINAYLKYEKIIARCIAFEMIFVTTPKRKLVATL